MCPNSAHTHKDCNFLFYYYFAFIHYFLFFIHKYKCKQLKTHLNSILIHFDLSASSIPATHHPCSMILNTEYAIENESANITSQKRIKNVIAMRNSDLVTFHMNSKVNWLINIAYRQINTRLWIVNTSAERRNDTAFWIKRIFHLFYSRLTIDVNRIN